MSGSGLRCLNSKTANIAAAQHNIQRRTCATGICQSICKLDVFDETFGVNSAFNAKVFVAPPHPVAMEFDGSGGDAVVIGLKDARSKDYTVKVYPNGSHNHMEVPPDNPNEWVRRKRFPPGFFETWSTGRQHSFVSVHQQGVLEPCSVNRMPFC